MTYFGDNEYLNITFTTTKSLTKLGWRLVVDWYVLNRILEESDTHSGTLSHRTLLPLQYPPHTLALGGLYVACLLTSFEQQPSNDDKIIAEELVKKFKQGTDWERKFQFRIEDLEGEQGFNALFLLLIVK